MAGLKTRRSISRTLRMTRTTSPHCPVQKDRLHEGGLHGIAGLPDRRKNVLRLDVSTGMCRVRTLLSRTDRIYEGGPKIIIQYNITL